MTDKTKIEWTDATWNPVTGCTKVSAGCDHCYAETIANRFAGTKAYPSGFDVTLWPDRLDQPLRWQRPRRIFVNSMSDLFHDEVPDEFIGRVFAVMALAPQHTFQVLTKRPGRMRSLLRSGLFQRWVEEYASSMAGRIVNHPWPLPNVWLGVSVENQKWADVRIPQLLGTPAAVRFLSCEPLLASVDLTGSGTAQTYWLTGRPEWGPEESVGDGRFVMQPLTTRTGPARCAISASLLGPFDYVTNESRVQIVSADGELLGRPWHGWALTTSGAEVVRRYGRRLAGRELDGRTWDEYPKETR